MAIDHRFSVNDRALIAEALRRVETARHRGTCDRSVLMLAISSAVLAGRRDLFNLVKAGQQAM